MAAIKPFRYLIVYPQMMRDMGRRWGASAGEPPPPEPQTLEEP
jgi:hypothetical protein